MAPLNAPLPTAWNLPFQFVDGSHISILMSESEDGRNVAATRQNVCLGALPEEADARSTASTTRENEIVAFGNFREANPSHAARVLADWACIRDTGICPL